MNKKKGGLATLSLSTRNDILPFHSKSKIMQKKYFLKTSGEKVSAIIIVPVGPDEFEGKKYSHIDNSPKGYYTFIAFAKKKFPGATEINFYCKKTGDFMEKTLLE